MARDKIKFQGKHYGVRTHYSGWWHEDCCKLLVLGSNSCLQHTLLARYKTNACLSPCLVFNDYDQIKKTLKLRAKRIFGVK
jgi:hypothetical protein